MTTNEWLKQITQTIEEIAPAQASSLQKQGAVLIDIRTYEEKCHGIPLNALSIERDFLEFRIEQLITDKIKPVIIICQTGRRSLLAAYSLHCCGYQKVASLAGGFTRWQTENFPIEKPFILSPTHRERYSRQLLLPEIGETGQSKLQNSKVLLVGVGGLGSPAALYLAAAGVGTLGIIDGDKVALNNLHRQIIHRESFIGQFKVDSAKSALQQLNSSINIIAYPEMLTVRNIDSIFTQYDVIVDGSDNFATRYLVNDFCVKLNLPNVHGSIFAFDGLVTVFWPTNADNAPCYRCIYPSPPKSGQVPSCAEGGVLGVLPGVIGILQATETIKLILNKGNTLLGRLLHYNAYTSQFHEYGASANPNCALCRNPKVFIDNTDYDYLHACVHRSVLPTYIFPKKAINNTKIS